LSQLIRYLVETQGQGDGDGVENGQDQDNGVPPQLKRVVGPNREVEQHVDEVGFLDLLRLNHRTYSMLVLIHVNIFRRLTLESQRLVFVEVGNSRQSCFRLVVVVVLLGYELEELDVVGLLVEGADSLQVLPTTLANCLLFQFLLFFLLLYNYLLPDVVFDLAESVVEILGCRELILLLSLLPISQVINIFNIEVVWSA